MTLKARITAIDRFIKGCKEDGIYDDLNACCVMAGWDSLAGALTPLKGAAPTNSGFIATDYDRGGIGITGDGTSYLNSNRADSADGQNDHHIAFHSTAGDPSIGEYPIGVRNSASPNTYTIVGYDFWSRSTASGGSPAVISTGTYGLSRNNGTSFNYMRANGTEASASVASTSATSGTNHFVFGINLSGTASFKTTATLAFYSIGSATDLALLDARVSTLMADLRAIEETGFDRDAIAYIRAVEAADGAYLETDVKVAVNNLVAGLKADGLWDAIGASCLLCGPRTLAGALVPLKGDAPTAYGFVAGDHFRDTGLQGDGTSYLDSNRANDADPQDDSHMAAYVASTASNPSYVIGADGGSGVFNLAGWRYASRSAVYGAFVEPQTGLHAVTRISSAQFAYMTSGVESVVTADSLSQTASNSVYVFARNTGTSANLVTNAKIAFYSIGTHVELAKLKSHITAYVTAIGAAL